MKQPVIKIYVDTNVLVNYFTGVENDILALNYIFSKRGKKILFTSTLALVQMVSQLQKKKGERAAFGKEKVIDCLDRIYQKFTILELDNNTLDKAKKIECKDVEDAVHYVISQKVNCDGIITNNKKDFYFCPAKKILSPQKELGQFSSYIQ